MPRLRTLDPAFPIERQLAPDAAPIVLVNVVTLEGADEQDFLKAWANDTGFMKRQPDVSPAQLHRATGDSATDLNYAVWDAIATFRAAFASPEFRATLSCYRSAAASPHLFHKVAVPDICVA